MSTIKTEDENVLANKQFVYGMCKQDGGLVAPIDLRLEDTRPLQLEPLEWLNFYEPPFRMKLTNSGDTVVISGKWVKERPYLTGGPLDGNYVFSQIHFHWGSTEHEGSEHTVRDICYPMEMHVVFFKTRYLSQAAALKQDDGVIILAYLFKLQSQSAPGLHWLATQLEKVVEPHTSTQVPSMPLATILVPFNEDYIAYWGALVSENCRHPIMWIVSRAALAISSDDLNFFRCLLNSRKEAMIKNFRVTNPAAGRAIFHINPSGDSNNLLLPGTTDPPCNAVIVNYSHTPPAYQTEAKKIFSKGDSNELEDKNSIRSQNQKEKMLEGKKRLWHEGLPRKNTVTKSTHKSKLEASSTERCPSPQIDKKANVGTKLQRQCTITKRLNTPGKARKTNSGSQDQNGDCVHINATTSYIVASGKSVKEGKAFTGSMNENTQKKVEVNKTKKSRLPVPKEKNREGKLALVSCYADYFQRPESAPTKMSGVETRTTKPTLQHTKLKPVTPVSESGMKMKATTTIPRPSTRHGSK